MVIFMLTLSCTFYLLHTDNLDENPVFWDTFLVFYSTTVGDTSGITDYDLAFSGLVDFFMIGSTFIFAIILLNLLVSIIGDIHGENKEAGTKTRVYELICILVDTNFSSTTKIARFFRKNSKFDKYLIKLFNEKHEEKIVNVYEDLEKKLDEKMKSNNQKNKKLIKEVQDKIWNLGEKFDKGWDKVKDYLEKQKQEEEEKKKQEKEEKKKKL